MPYRRDRRHDRDNYFYVGAVWPWWLSSYGYLGNPDFYEYPPWWGYDDSSDSQVAASQGPTLPDYEPQLPPPDEQPDSPSLPPWPSIYSPNPPENPNQQSAPVYVEPPQPVEPVTLVFNDGRPSEKIHNFVVTAGTLYVMDQQRQDIPIAELDLVATARVNRQAGVEFNIPGASR